VKQFRVILGLALIPVCTIVGGFIPIGGGSAAFIGLIIGIACSFVFLNYGPGSKKNTLPTSYYLGHQHQMNGGVNQQVIENGMLGALEATQQPRIERKDF